MDTLPDFASTLAAVKTGRVACFTGHRNASFPFKYNESDPGCIEIKRQLRRACEMAYRQGFRTFITGMALGVDTWAAEELISIQRNSIYADIVIVGAVPCVGQDSKWPPDSQKRYQNILAAINTWGYVSKVTFDEDRGCMTNRNIAMIDPSDVVIAVYDGKGHGIVDRRARALPGSGTGHAVAYALNAKKKVLRYDWENTTLALLPALSEASSPAEDDIPF